MNKFLKALVIFTASLASQMGLASSPIRVIGYEVDITLDIKVKTVTGQTIIRFDPLVSGLSEVRFPRNGLNILSTKVAGLELPFQANGGEIVIQLPNVMKAERVELSGGGQD